MPQHSQNVGPKSKEEPKPQVDKPKGDAGSEQAAELSELTGELARQLTTQAVNPSNPDAPPASAQPNPLFSPHQMALLQRKVGNQAARQMLDARGGMIQLEPLSEKEKQEAQKGLEDKPGEFKEEYEGFILTPDEAVLEKILKSVIASKGFDGATQFINGYGLRTPPKPEQKEVHDKIVPMLQSKLASLVNEGKEYAEKTFRAAAEKNLLQILADSEKTVQSESEKYGRTYAEEKGGTSKGEQLTAPKGELSNEQNAAEMAAAAKDLVARQAKIDDLNKKRESYEQKTYAPKDTGKDKGYSIPEQEVVDTKITDPEAHKQTIEEIKKAQQEYDIARQAAEARHPVLASFRPPAGMDQLKTIAEGKKEDRDSIIVKDIEEKLKNIADIRGVANDGRFVFQQPSIVHATKSGLGVQPGSIQDHGIADKVKSVETNETLKNLGLALVSLIAGALLALPSGGASVAGAAAAVAGGAALGAASIYTLYEGIRQYQIEKAAGGTNFDKAKAISQTEPSLFWLAVNIVGAITDLGSAAKLFSRAAAAIRMIGKVEDARAAASAAYRSAGLEGVMSEEEFIQQFLRTMGEDAEALAAKVKARAGLMESLKDASNPTTKALMAGDHNSIIKLVQSHGKWEVLVSELEKGTPEMKQIAANIVNFRKQEVLGKLSEMLGFDIKEIGGSKHTTSDLDIPLESSGSTGAGEKVMKAETYMNTKFGPGWEEAWRVNFYTDLKSRLLITETAEFQNLLTEAEKAELKIKQHQMATKFNMARRMKAAAGNPEMIGLIEDEALEAGVDLFEIHRLAETGEDAARLERNKLLLQADAVEAQFRAATTPEAKKALGKKLQALQMEANFYTNEATISVGAGLEIVKMGTAEGIQVADSMLEWTAMLEHKVGEYSSLGEALHDYESWKYINRIAAQARKAAVDESFISRIELLQIRADYIANELSRSQIWAREVGHLTIEVAELDRKNKAIISSFLAETRQLGSDIRGSELKKLEAAADGT